MKFTHLFGKITHTFTIETIEYLHIHFNFNKKRTKLIHIDLYAALMLAKKAAIYMFLLCKIVGPKIRLCKIFDKFQVCFTMISLEYVFKGTRQNAFKRFSSTHCDREDLPHAQRFKTSKRERKPSKLAKYIFLLKNGQKLR